MKVNKVSFVKYEGNICKNYTNNRYAKQIDATNDVFVHNTPVFTGLQSSIIKFSKNNIDNLTDLKNVFSSLISDVYKDKRVKFTDDFANFNNQYKENGFKGLMDDLREISSTYDPESFVVSLDKMNMPLANVNGKPVIYVGNGEFGGLFSRSKNDIKIKFQCVDDKTSKIIFFAENDGRNNIYSVLQKTYTDSVYKGFYESTGSKRFDVVTDIFGNVEKNFYKPDGSKSFLENLFLS